ncbi:hypothetical protein HN451_08070 [archaeon]|nr:hypothetical protein [archaeon]
MGISTKEAATILKINPRTVRQRVKSGYLVPLSTSPTLLFDDEQVYTLQRREAAQKVLRNVNRPIDMVKESYILLKTGVSLETICEEYNIEEDSLEDAVDLYKVQRRNILRGYGLGDKKSPDTLYENWLLVDEVLARLKITDSHVVYNLSIDNDISMEKIRRAPIKYIVNAQSFNNYLGDVKGEILYTSKETEEEIGLNVNQIDKIAKSHSIGRKLRSGSKNSIYLFTDNERSKISRLS